MSDILFGALEREYGLPSGILDEIWRIESSRGKNMFNPTSGATGHFQIIKPNYIAAGIDPMNLFQSANWTADYARQAMNRFPNLDPTYAIAAHHYAGPNTALWGPKTRDYANTIVSRMGGAQPAPAIGGIPSIPQLPTMMPISMPTASRQPLNTRDLVRDPRFWFDMAASMDPKQAPMAALVTGLSNAYSRADERRLAFEGGIGNIYAQMQQRMWSQQEKQAEREWERQKLQIQEQRLRDQMALEKREFDIREAREQTETALDLRKFDAAEEERQRKLQAMEELGKTMGTRDRLKLLATGKISEKESIADAKTRDDVMEGTKWIRGQYLGAGEDLSLAERTMRMLEKGAATGFGAGLLDSWKKVTGVSKDDLAKSETFRIETSKYLMRQLQDQPGSSTDFELQYWAGVSPGDKVSEAGNYLALELLRRNAYRRRDRGRKWNDYVSDTLSMGGSPSIQDFDENYYRDPFPPFDPDAMLRQFRQRKLQAGGSAPAPTVSPTPAPAGPQPGAGPIPLPTLPGGGLPPGASVDNPSRGGG